MNILWTIDTWIEKFIGWLLIFFLGVMIVMAFGQVVLRNFFNSSIEWGDVFLRHLVLWVGFFGATIATGEGRHLKIEFLAKMVNARTRKIFFIITNIFASIVCYFLFRASLVFITMERESASILILNFPTWYFITILPVGYAMISFRFVVAALHALVETLHSKWTMKEHV
mgnify:CR=1 FL=1